LTATDVAAVKGIEKLSPADLRALAEAAAVLNINPDWLATVMSFESGFRPEVRNAAGSGATGLIQFMPSTARGLGTTTDELAQMTFAEQIPYVVQYLAPHMPFPDLDSVYLAIFYPAAKNHADDWVVASDGSAVYTQNKGFDREGKGYVTRHDITSTIRGVLNAASGKPRIPIPGMTIMPGPGALGVIFVVLALGGASYLAATTRAKTLRGATRDGYDRTRAAVHQLELKTERALLPT